MAKHDKALKFLKLNPMAVLSTVAENGKPWGSAIYYVADEEFNFYFVTRAKTFKFQNLEKNPYAALTVADNESQTTVQAQGKISKLPLDSYMDVIFDKLAKIKPVDNPHWAPPISKIQAGDFIPLKLTPSKLQFANYKPQKLEKDAKYIEILISEGEE